MSSVETTNNSTKRLVAIDIARGSSVFFMVFVHTLWMFGDKITQTESVLGQMVHLLGKGTAFFMVVMGICLVLSSKNSENAWKKTLKRGVFILFVGYLMNTLKFIVPIVVGTMPEAFIQAYGWESPINFNQYLYLFLTGDILQMAGISLLMIGVMQLLKFNKWMYAFIALMITLYCQELSGFRLGVSGIDYVMDLLWGSQFNVYFPVFPWIVPIIVGMFVGFGITEKSRTQKELANYFLKIGTPLLVIGGAFYYWDKAYHFNDFFHIGPGGILYVCGFVLIPLSLVMHILALFKTDSLNDSVFIKFITYMSARVTSLYVIQWTLVCWMMGIIGFNTLSLYQTLAMMPVMLMLTLLTQWALDKILFKLRSVKAQKSELVATSA